ncbi:MAG: pyridoxal phosphate-dependent aminotransferase [Candidatus Eiseniibacteriota bacterium]|nr:MAG: pyridoxal phosphate-dependent aminotransferase [Candidatus Eisenbacteria bacterium]
MYAKRMKRLGTETAFEVLARAKQLEAKGVEVIHLEIGEPDFDTPANISRAAVKALEEGYTHYGPSAGLPEFREELAKYVSKDRGMKVRPENVVVTPGAKPILFFSALAILEEGDDAIYPNPGFPIYESVIEFLGAKAVPMRLREENDFGIDLDEFESLLTPRTRMIILNSPQNPTGGVLERAQLERIAELVRDRDLFVLTDEVYCKILYEGEHVSIATLPGMQEKTIILDGYSKTYAMTGWRLGFGVMNETLAAHVSRLQTNCTSCTCSFTQRAGIEGITGPQEDSRKMVAEFKRRREVMVQGLNSIKGVSCLTPRGAFYVFPNVTKTGIDCKELASRLLEEKGVAVLSGTAFGEFGKGYLRLSYANSVENIQKGLGRMRELIEGR